MMQLPPSPSTAQTALDMSPSSNTFLLWTYPQSCLPGVQLQESQSCLCMVQLWGAGGSSAENPSEHPHTTSSFYSKGSRVEFPRQDLQPLCTAHPQPHLLHPILPSAISLGAHKGQQGCPCPVQVQLECWHRTSPLGVEPAQGTAGDTGEPETAREGHLCAEGQRKKNLYCSESNETHNYSFSSISLKSTCNINLKRNTV